MDPGTLSPIFGKAQKHDDGEGQLKYPTNERLGLGLSHAQRRPHPTFTAEDMAKSVYRSSIVLQKSPDEEELAEEEKKRSLVAEEIYQLSLAHARKEAKEKAQEKLMNERMCEVLECTSWLDDNTDNDSDSVETSGVRLGPGFSVLEQNKASVVEDNTGKTLDACEGIWRRNNSWLESSSSLSATNAEDYIVCLFTSSSAHSQIC
jgi:hypothetical protein